MTHDIGTLLKTAIPILFCFISHVLQHKHFETDEKIS